MSHVCNILNALDLDRGLPYITTIGTSFLTMQLFFFPIISGFDQAESLQWVKRGSGHLAQLIVSNWSSHSYFSEAPFMEKHYGFPNTPMLIQNPQFRVNDSPLDALFKDKLTPQHILTTPKNTFENK